MYHLETPMKQAIIKLFTFATAGMLSTCINPTFQARTVEHPARAPTYFQDTPTDYLVTADGREIIYLDVRNQQVTWEEYSSPEARPRIHTSPLEQNCDSIEVYNQDRNKVLVFAEGIPPALFQKDHKDIYRFVAGIVEPEEAKELADLTYERRFCLNL